MKTYRIEKKGLRRITVLVIFMSALFSCNRGDRKPDIRDISVSVSIERFEQDLFEMDTDTLPEAIAYFYSRYEDFYDIFNYYIVDLGKPSDKAYPGFLRLFVNDDLNREVYNYVNEVFPDLSWLEDELSLAFRYYLHYFPGEEIPRVVSFVSRFNYPFFTVTDYLGIGLDMFLGIDAEFYSRLGLPGYQVQNMYPEKISSEVLGNWANSLFPFNDSVNNVLSHIIHEGKIMYFLSKILPGQDESRLLGFSEEQMKWITSNERQMWEYLVEHKLVYSTDPMNIRKLVQPAPFTSFFGSESPGRASVWIGYRIVSDYLAKTKNISLAELMHEGNYQNILKGSRYNP